MTKQELIDRVYRQRGLPNDLTKKLVAEIVDGVFNELRDYFATVDEEESARFTYPGFGTFSKKLRPARTLRHPRTGAKIAVPEKHTLAFSVGSRSQSAAQRPLKSGARSGATVRDVARNVPISPSRPDYSALE